MILERRSLDIIHHGKPFQTPFGMTKWTLHNVVLLLRITSQIFHKYTTPSFTSLFLRNKSINDVFEIGNNSLMQALQATSDVTVFPNSQWEWNDARLLSFAFKQSTFA